VPWLQVRQAIRALTPWDVTAVAAPGLHRHFYYTSDLAVKYPLPLWRGGHCRKVKISRVNVRTVSCEKKKSVASVKMWLL